MTFPYTIDLEDLYADNFSLESWVYENPVIMNLLVLKGAETLASQPLLESITLIEVWLDGQVLALLDLNRENMAEALEHNQTNWVNLEEYEKAAHARDLLNQLKN
jgi:hypothetical protein